MDTPTHPDLPLPKCWHSSFSSRNSYSSTISSTTASNAAFPSSTFNCSTFSCSSSQPHSLHHLYVHHFLLYNHLPLSGVSPPNSSEAIREPARPRGPGQVSQAPKPNGWLWLQGLLWSVRRKGTLSLQLIGETCDSHERTKKKRKQKKRDDTGYKALFQ